MELKSIYKMTQVITSHHWISIASSVSVSVCVSARVSKNVSKFHDIFCACQMWSWFGPPLTTVQICYVLLVMWMTSYFQIIGLMSQNQRRRNVSLSLPDGGAGGEVVVYDCKLVFNW